MTEDEYTWDLPPSPRHLAIEGAAGPSVMCGADPESGIHIVGTRSTADCPECLR